MKMKIGITNSFPASGMRAAALFFDVAPTEVANGVGVVDVVAVVAAAEPVSSTISGGALPS